MLGDAVEWQAEHPFRVVWQYQVAEKIMRISFVAEFLVLCVATTVNVGEADAMRFNTSTNDVESDGGGGSGGEGDSGNRGGDGRRSLISAAIAGSGVDFGGLEADTVHGAETPSGVHQHGSSPSELKADHPSAAAAIARDEGSRRRSRSVSASDGGSTSDGSKSGSGGVHRSMAHSPPTVDGFDADDGDSTMVAMSIGVAAAVAEVSRPTSDGSEGRDVRYNVTASTVLVLTLDSPTIVDSFQLPATAGSVTTIHRTPTSLSPLVHLPVSPCS
jgi:hypothetical protein